MLAHRAVVYFDDSDGQRKIFGMLDSLEVKVNVNYVDYTKVGSNAKHRAASTYEISFDIGAFTGTNFFEKNLKAFIDTGKMPKFSILANQLDEATVEEFGSRSLLLLGCIIESDTLIKVTTSEEIAKYSMSGYAESYELLDTFVDLAGEY